METYIILLKGINVGGHKKVPMAELRSILSDLGFESVKTYIQSGNVILKSSEKKIQTIEYSIKEGLLGHFGFEVSVLVLTPQHLRRIFDNSPFDEETKKGSYFMMLHKEPSEAYVAEVSKKIYEGEEYVIIKDCIYYYSSKGFGKSKFNLNYFERKLETFATARNYNTMVKLLSLSAEIEEND